MTVSSIGSGRDYETIEAWLAACPANLVTATDQWIGELYNDAEFYISDADGIQPSGITTSADYYIELRAATGEGWTANDALTYDTSQGVCVRGAGFLFQPAVAYMRFKGIQFKAGPGYFQCFHLETGLAGFPSWEECLFYTDGTLSSYVCGIEMNNDDYTVKNCAFITANNGIMLAGDRGTMHNNTFLRIGNAGGSAIVNPFAPSGGIECKNNAFFRFGQVATNSSGCTGSNNATDLGSVGFGTSNQTSLTVTDQIMSITSGSEDLRAQADGALPGNGVDISGLTTDFRGTSRANPPAIGCWEISRAIVLGSGSYSITGNAVDFPANTIKLETGSYTVTGNNIQVNTGDIGLTSGSYTITGSTMRISIPGANSLWGQPWDGPAWTRTRKPDAKLTGRMRKKIR